jgi:hypothetical protein
MGILNHDEILRLRAAIISARLGNSRTALLAGIDAALIASLPNASAPGDHILTDLDALNEAGTLREGSVPLVTWLSNAAALAGERTELDVFEEALERSARATGAMIPVRDKTVHDPHATNHQAPVAAVHHHHGDVHMGSKFTTNITGSTVGAFAQGNHAVATGTVTVGAAGSVTQEQHKAAMANAQTALVRDQDALERIDDRLYEALGQFLALARKIQVEQQGLAEVQEKMKTTLDEIWAQQAAKGMKPQMLPKTLEVVKALMDNPVMGEVTKKLLGG